MHPRVPFGRRFPARNRKVVLFPDTRVALLPYRFGNSSQNAVTSTFPREASRSPSLPRNTSAATSTYSASSALIRGCR